MAKYVQSSPTNCHANLTMCEGYEKAKLLGFFFGLLSDFP